MSCITKLFIVLAKKDRIKDFTMRALMKKTLLIFKFIIMSYYFDSINVLVKYYKSLNFFASASSATKLSCRFV